MSSSKSDDPICITNITLKVRPQSGKTIDHIVVQSKPGSIIKDISKQVSPGEEHNEALDPVIKLSAKEQLSVSMQYRSRRWCLRRGLSIAMEGSDVMTKAQDDGQGKQVYSTSHRNIEVAFCYSADSKGPRIAPSLPTIVSPQNDVLIPPNNPRDPSPAAITEEPGLSSSAPDGRFQGAPSVPTSREPVLPPPTNVESSQGALSVPSTGAPVPPVSSNNGSSQGVPLPTTDEIRKICPRFRLLIVGNTGVGKSTLIHKVFGVEGMDVSDKSRGKADINSEFVAAENGYFVLHDSIGLEAGDSKNFNTIKSFIGARRREDDLKDRLHAVWVCLSVPFAKGRLLEAGMEEFLRDRKTILGDIPVVVVLTKLDLLDNSLTMALRKEGVTFKTMKEVQPHLEPRRTKYIEEFCGKPLQRTTGGDIPHVAVSTKSGYELEPTIPELVKTTTSEIERYIRDNLPSAKGEQPSIEQRAQLYMAGMAQRVSIEENVNLTIALGKQNYWTSLRSYKGFSPDKVKEYLLAIHQDIIRVWNFNDPTEALQSIVFKEALLDTSNLEVEINRDVPNLESADPSVAALAPLINGLIGAFLTLPVTGANYLRQFIREADQSSKCFMAYIVHLVYIMRILFILAPQGAVTSEDVALAVEVYRKSSYRNRVHMEIRDFSMAFPIFRGARDAVVDKMEELIRRYNITDKEVENVRSQIRRPKRSA